MAEEKDTTPEMNLDDISVLRILLHNVKGLSASSTTTFVPVEDDIEA